MLWNYIYVLCCAVVLDMYLVLCFTITCANCNIRYMYFKLCCGIRICLYRCVVVLGMLFHAVVLGAGDEFSVSSHQ